MGRIGNFLAAMSTAALAACASGNAPVGLESRSIAVTENAIPTSGAAAAGISVTSLLPSIGPTYVTLNVTAIDRFADQKNRVKAPVTSGSGYVVDGSGYVMTAAHVAVDEGNAISARAANGKVYSGQVVAISKANDMAIIKLKGYSGPAVRPAAPGCVNQGDLVFTLGKPRDQTDTARIGALDSRHFGRAVAYGKFGYPDAMVLRMGTQKGESGGPVFNGRGQFIGMVVSTLSDAAGQSINLAHAIPSTTLARFLCTESECSGEWAALARQSVDICPGV